MVKVPKSSLCCTKCPAQFTCSACFIKHVAKCNGCKVVNNPICIKKKTKEPIAPKSKAFTCPHCSKPYSNQAWLFKHILTCKRPMFDSKFCDVNDALDFANVFVEEFESICINKMPILPSYTNYLQHLIFFCR